MIRLLIFLFPFLCFGTTCKENLLYCNWLVYYSDKAPIKAFQAFDPIVLDSKYHPPLKPLQKMNKVLYGYISLGEVEQHRSYFKKAQEKDLLIEENPFWPGSYFVDVRDEQWARLLLDEVIPSLLTKGFQGLFIDTLDNPIYLEEKDPEKYEGMRSAAAQLVKLIHIYFPDVYLMINRAYLILPDVGDQIHAVLGESLYTDYDFETKTYSKVKHTLYLKQVQILQNFMKKFPHVEVYSLDYWDPKDFKTIQEIYAEERKNGFRPYVSTIELNEIIFEPK